MKKEEKEKLEFLYNIISGYEEIKIQTEKKSRRKTPRSDIEKRTICLDDADEYNLVKSKGLQELGHIWLSGSLKQLSENWNESKYGNFDDFKTVVNILEDMRTENLLSIRYPQLKNRLTNCHIKEINEFLELNPEYVAKEPKAALYLAAEDRFKIPIGIDPEVKEIFDKFKEILQRDDFKNQNWKNMVDGALNISEHILKWNKEKFGEMEEMLQQMMQQMDQVSNQYHDNIAEQKRLNSKVDHKQSEMNNVVDPLLNMLRERQKQLESSPDGTPEMKKQKEEYKKRLGEKIKKQEIEKESLKKDVNEIEDYIKGLGKETDKIYNEQYKPGIEKQEKLGNKISKLRNELSDNFEVLPTTFRHDFEKLQEKNLGKGKSLTKAQMEAMAKKEKDTNKKKEDGMMGKLGDLLDGQIESRPTAMKMFQPKSKGPLQERPEIVTYNTSDDFISEGIYTIPNLKLALSMGYEISSALKRELKLKDVVLKHRLVGNVDIKNIKKQLAKYKMIVDPRVMKIKKPLIEKHSVLVLTDFSGSMGGRVGSDKYTKVQHAKQALVTLGKTLEGLNVRYSLRGFSATTNKFRICDIIMKDFDDPTMDYKLIDKMYYPVEGRSIDNCQNRDGDSIRNATRLLMKQRGKKLLIVISDGIPHHPSGKETYGTGLGTDDTIRSIKEAENEGVRVMGISIARAANAFILEAYPNSFIFNDLKQFPHQLTKMYVKTIMGRK